jgi:hypothetical protein
MVNLNPYEKRILDRLHETADAMANDLTNGNRNAARNRIKKLAPVEAALVVLMLSGRWSSRELETLLTAGIE